MFFHKTVKSLTVEVNTDDNVKSATLIESHTVGDFAIYMVRRTPDHKPWSLAHNHYHNTKRIIAILTPTHIIQIRHIARRATATTK